MLLEKVKPCSVRGCIFPRRGRAECLYHQRFFTAPWQPGCIAWSDIYAYTDPLNSDPADRLRTPLYCASAKEVFAKRPIVHVWRAGFLQKEYDPYKDPAWGLLAAQKRDFLNQEARPKPGKPNLLSLDAVILPDGRITKTIIESESPGTVMANHNSTGAFILWKGYGKKKIRKSQRERPQGWHGNHPSRKPVKKFSRETLDDIPIRTPEIE